jgi:predicted nucleic acid-binding protein
MTADLERERAARQHKRDNAQTFVLVLAMFVVLALAVFTAARFARIQRDADQANRDGISCILGHLAEHRTHDNEPLTIEPPPVAALLGSCERFFTAPGQ